MQTPCYFPEEMSDEKYKSWSSSVCSLLQFPLPCALSTPTFVPILVNSQASFSWLHKNLVARRRGVRQLLCLCLLVYFDEWIEVSLGKWEDRKKNQAIVCNKNLSECTTSGSLLTTELSDAAANDGRSSFVQRPLLLLARGGTMPRCSNPCARRVCMWRERV